MLDTKNEKQSIGIGTPQQPATGVNLHQSNGEVKNEFLLEDELWIGDEQAFDEEIEEIENVLGYKLNPKKALWLYAQMHNLDKDVLLTEVELKMVEMICVASRVLVQEEREEERHRINELINYHKWIYDWFRQINEFKVISFVPRFH